jgi:predicted glycoside hydrolase/deacetylase ChbG (UPF0249 family)/methylase of polypeptide subunit release factors
MLPAPCGANALIRSEPDAAAVAADAPLDSPPSLPRGMAAAPARPGAIATHLALAPTGTSVAPAAAPGASAASAGRVRARSVILEADDLGLLYAFNEGIRAAWRDGLLTSTCLRANGCAYEHALREVLPACPGLGVGLHWCLNEAAPVAAPRLVRRLLGADGQLRRGFCWLMGLAGSSQGLAQIECELRAQIEKVLADGVSPDHVNSHQHVHMIPAIFRVACRLAREYGIPAIRLVRELPYSAGGFRRTVQPLVNSNLIKHVLLNRFARQNEPVTREYALPTTDYFVGVAYASNMSRRTILAGLAAVPCGSVEVLLHPAIGPDPRDQRYPVASLYHYVRARQREVELRSLCSPRLGEFLRREGWMPTTFRQWAEAQQRELPRSSTPRIDERIRAVCESTPISAPPWVSAAQNDSRAFAQLVAHVAPPSGRVLDLGTGSGVIAICLRRLGYQVLAADISGAALRTARANARRNGVELPCVRSDLLASIEGRFDLIAFNPPYSFAPDTLASNVARNLLRRVPWVRRHSGVSMPRPVLRFHQQLIARLVAQAPGHLQPGGRILLHAYESEVSALTRVLPEGSTVELLHHPGFTNRTVGMSILLPQQV